MIKNYFTEMLKKVRENKPKIQNRFYTTDLLPEPSPFHMYNLRKVDMY